MKKNYNLQSFFITCVIFSPLLAFAIYGDPFKFQVKGEDKITLVLNQFVAAGTAAQVGENTAKTAKEEVKEKPKELKKEVKKPKPKKESPKKEPKKQEEKQEIQKSANEASPQASQLDNKQPTQIGSLASGKENDIFLQDVKKAIDKAARKSYPKQALRMRITGEVLVEFWWLSNGALDKIKILKSSGHQILDDSAINIVRRASKEFPLYSKNVLVQIVVPYKIH